MSENKEATNNEILEAINDFANITESRFGKIENEMTEIKGEIKEIKGKIGKMENNMVTTSYLDEKMSDLRGDLVVMMRKEDTKVKTLVNILREKKIISEDDVQKIISMEPFAQS